MTTPTTPRHHEHGWLIEDDVLSRIFGHHMYWCGGVRWDHDSFQAVRFARQADGEVQATYLRGTPRGNVSSIVVRQHVWMDVQLDDGKIAGHQADATIVDDPVAAEPMQVADFDEDILPEHEQLNYAQLEALLADTYHERDALKKKLEDVTRQRAEFEDRYAEAYSAAQEGLKISLRAVEVAEAYAKDNAWLREAREMLSVERDANAQALKEAIRQRDEALKAEVYETNRRVKRDVELANLIQTNRNLTVRVAEAEAWTRSGGRMVTPGMVVGSAPRQITTTSIVPEDVEWIVNNYAELGVKIGDLFVFLWKGHSLEYETETLTWRPVYKREFGETQHPIGWPTNGSDERYTFGNPEDWQELAPRAQGKTSS